MRELLYWQRVRCQVSITTLTYEVNNTDGHTDFAASYNSVSSLSGETRNAYNQLHESGGSSAGTGAAIAANYGLIGLGEDTGGSIRVPASFNNLVGLRPTVGMVSRAGLSPLIKTNDTPGPMTRTVRDAALMFDALVGYDAKDLWTANAGTQTPPKGGSYAANLSEETLAKAKLGVLKEAFGDGSESEHEAVNKAVRSALARFTTGTKLVDVTIPGLQHYWDFTTTYMSRSRWDINNFLAAHPVIKDVTFESMHSSKQYHPSLALFEKLGEGIAHPKDDPEYGERLDQQQEFQRVVTSVMIENGLDAIVYPSVKITPPTIEDTLGKRFWDYFPTNTSIGSQLRWPAISVPIGFTDDGLPVGLEILGVPYSEQKLLELAYGVEALIKARKPPTFAQRD